MYSDKDPIKNHVETAESIFNLFKEVSLFSRKRFMDVFLTIFIVTVSGFIYLAFIYGKTQLDLIKKQLETYRPVEIPRNIIISSTEDNKRINSILYDLLLKTRADRSYVFQFHNGRKGLSGVEFLFMTNTHEQVMPGVSSEISNLQSVPISIGTEMLEDMIKDGEGKCWITENIKDSSTRGILQRQATKYLCFDLIHDTEGNLIGFTGVDYVNRPVPNDINISNYMAINSAKIEELLKREELIR